MKNDKGSSLYGAGTLCRKRCSKEDNQKFMQSFYDNEVTGKIKKATKIQYSKMKKP